MAILKIYNDIQTENEKNVARFWGDAEGVCFKDIDEFCESIAANDNTIDIRLQPLAKPLLQPLRAKPRQWQQSYYWQHLKRADARMRTRNYLFITRGCARGLWAIVLTPMICNVTQTICAESKRECLICTWSVASATEQRCRHL